MASDRPRIIFEPGHVRVGPRGVAGIKVGGGTPGGRGTGHGGGAGGHGRGRGAGNSLGHLVSAFGAIAGASVSQGVPSPPDVSALTLLSTTTLAAPGSIDVTGISQAYNDLVIVAMVRSTVAGSTTDGLLLYLNNDTTVANYNYANDLNNAATPTSFQGLGVAPQINTTIPGNLATAARFAPVCIEILGYTSTTWEKTCVAVTGVSWSNASGATRALSATTHWMNTAAVTQITLVPQTAATLAIGSTARVYGRT